MRKSLIELLAGLLATGPAEAATPRQIFLKLNHFLVLYTRPAIPYIGPGGGLMVAAGAPLAWLLDYPDPHASFAPESASATAKLDPAAGTLVLTRGDHWIRFTVGSKAAVTDGGPLQMSDTVLAAPGSEDFLVPVRAIAEAFHLRSTWNERTRVFSLTGKGLGPADVPEQVDSEHPDRDMGALVPVSITLHRGLAPNYPADFTKRNHYFAPAPDWRWLTLTVRNASRSNIPLNHAFFNSIVVASNRTDLAGIPFYLPGNRTSPPPPLRAGATRSISMEIEGPNVHDTDYVVAWPVATLPESHRSNRHRERRRLNHTRSR